MQTAYGKNRKARASSEMQGATRKGVIGIGAFLGGAALVLGGNPILGAAGITAGVATFSAGVRQLQASKGSRAKAHAIEHLVQYGRRNKGGSQKQIEAGAHGIIKAHYATNNKGTRYFVKEHSRKSRMA